MAVHHEGNATALRLRRAAFVRWVRLRARRAGATVELDVAGDVIIGRGVRVRFDPGTHNVLRVGTAARLRDDVRIHLHGGRIEIGPYCDVRDATILNVGGAFTMGEAGILSWGCTVHCDGEIRFGAWAGASDGAVLVDSTHYHSDPDTPFHANLKAGTIEVGRHTWLGTRAIVLRNSRIGDYCTVGAGAVVSGEVPDGHLALGNPAVVSPRRSPLPWLVEPEPAG